MAAKLKSQKKQILADPVAEFSSRYPEADEKAKQALTNLQHQLDSLNNLRRKTQLQTKSISRQIGNARRDNQPVDSFMVSMKEHSSNLKQLDKQLSELEHQVLRFFETENSPLLNMDTSNEILPDVTPVSRQYTTEICNEEDINVSLLDNEHSEWNDYVSTQPAANIHHMVEWRDLFHKTYGHESFYYIARDKTQQIVGILPLVRLRSRLFGDMFVTMPYFQRGGAIGNHPLIEQKLIQTANDHAAQLGVNYVEYRDDVTRENLPAQSHKVNMVLALPGSKELLWQAFTPKLRAQIKRPQRENPEVCIGGEEYLDDFYKVYTHNMRDLGSPAHSRRLVENILDQFPENSWIIVLRLNNKPVSAGLLLGRGTAMEIPLASTRRDGNPLSLNMLLYWEALKLAILQGYRTFDFGRSSWDSGTFRFKRQWGTQPKQLYWHYWLNDSNEMPSLNPTNPKYALIINIWKRLPVALTRWLGPMIVKNIP